MNDRTTLSIVILAVALAALVVFLEHDVSTVPYQSPERFKVLRGLTQDNVERITLLALGDQTIHLQRSSDRWFFKRPLPGTDGYAVEWEADPEAVNRLVDVLVALREAAPALARPSGSPLDDTGLGRPQEQERIEVTLGTETGAMLTKKLHLGNPVPGERDRMYVQLDNDDRILIVEDTLGQMMRLAREGGLAFRARNVFARSDLADTAKVALDTAGYRAELEKVAGRIWEARWTEKTGTDAGRTFTDRASSDRIKTLAEAMQGLRVERFVADTAAREDFAECGLLEPAVQRILLTLADQSSGLAALFSGPSTAELRVGHEVKEAPDQVYASAQRMPAIFTIKKSFLEKLPARGRDLAARRLVDFESARVKSLTLLNAHGKVQASKEDYDWSLTEPLKIGGDYARLNGLVDAITATDCEDLVWEGEKGLGDFGLSAPKAELVVRYEDEDPSGRKRILVERIQVGNIFEKEAPPEGAAAGETKPPDDKTAPEEDKPDDKPAPEEDKPAPEEDKPAPEEDKPDDKPAPAKLVYARRVGDVAVRVFPHEKLKSLLDPPLSFVKKRVLEFNGWDATTFVLERPSGRYRFQKEGQDWKMVEPATIRADAGNVGGLVSAMSWLNADAIVAGADGDVAAFGLDQPRYRLTATVKVVEEDKKAEGEKKEAATGKAEDDGTAAAPEDKPDGDAPGKAEDDQDKPAKTEDTKKTEKLVTHELIVSAKKEGETETFYARASSGSLVFTLEKSFADKLEGELADTDLFPLEWNVREATAESAGRVVRMTRDADGSAFQVSSTKEGELRTAETEPARAFFTKLGATKVQGHYLSYDAKDLTPYGFEPELFAQITSADKDGKTVTLEVGAPADPARHGEGLRHARRAGASAVFLVKQEDLDALLKPATAYLPEAERKEAEAAAAGPPAPAGDGEEKQAAPPVPGEEGNKPKEAPAPAEPGPKPKPTEPEAPAAPAPEQAPKPGEPEAPKTPPAEPEPQEP
ncbi:MAG: DUF4340 domain-containing protein [Planctomycetes bacterium]|nr:DUF4340 domain-containing protein [Planctomycetota bacterium]